MVDWLTSSRFAAAENDCRSYTSTSVRKLPMSIGSIDELTATLHLRIAGHPAYHKVM